MDVQSSCSNSGVSQLHDASHQIRLLRLDLNSNPPLLRGALPICDAEYPPEYTAISYTWGPLRNSSSISLDGQKVSIGEHFWYALCQLLDRRHDRPI
jgi:hypothetical protein